MDTLLLMSEKDAEIQQLRDELQAVYAEMHALKGTRASQLSVAAPPPTDAALAEAHNATRKAEQRADRAELELAEQRQALTKLQAKLNAVSTLYTEAAQREAVLRLQLEQSGGGSRAPSYE